LSVKEAAKYNQLVLNALRMS